MINDEKHMDYINSWDEFKMYEGVQKAFKVFSQRFGLIFIITNQRGIAKGMTKTEDLNIIHKNLTSSIISTGGRLDRIYYCSDMDDSSPNRKPNPGMALQAKKDFPSIDFSKSVMIGNTISDMGFGRNAGIAVNIFLPTTHPELVLNPMIDLVFTDLISVALAL